MAYDFQSGQFVDDTQAAPDTTSQNPINQNIPTSQPIAKIDGDVADGVYDSPLGRIIVRNGLAFKYEDQAAKPEEHGDFYRGAATAVKQMPQLFHGLEAYTGAVGEKLFGKGGLATHLKKHGLEEYRKDSADIQKDAKPTDSATEAWNRAKKGDIGALVDFLQYGLGYMAVQGAMALTGAGAGALVGKAALTGSVTKLAEGMVAKEAAKIAAEKSAAKISRDEAIQEATKRVAEKIGRNTALAGQAVGMEGGEIGGGLVDSADRKGRELSGAELAKAFGATLAAGGLEFVGDKFGIDLVTGKKALGKGVKGYLGRSAVQGARGAAVEGGTEAAQTIAEHYGKGQDIFANGGLRDIVDSAALGLLGGAAMGPIAGLHNPLHQQEQASHAASLQAPAAQDRDAVDPAAMKQLAHDLEAHLGNTPARDMAKDASDHAALDEVDSVIDKGRAQAEKDKVVRRGLLGLPSPEPVMVAGEQGVSPIIETPEMVQARMEYARRVSELGLDQVQNAAIGRAPILSDVGLPKGDIDAIESSQPEASPNVHQPEAAVTVSLPKGAIVRKNGQPFATERSAKAALKAKRLIDTHAVQPVDGGFALVPSGDGVIDGEVKPPSEVDKEAISRLEAQNEPQEAVESPETPVQAVDVEGQPEVGITAANEQSKPEPVEQAQTADVATLQDEYKRLADIRYRIKSREISTKDGLREAGVKRRIDLDRRLAEIRKQIEAAKSSPVEATGVAADNGNSIETHKLSSKLNRLTSEHASFALDHTYKAAKPKYIVKTIAIPTAKGHQDVKAEVIGDFAVHKALDGGGYVVSHVPSGKVSFRSDTKKSAKKAAWVASETTPAGLNERQILDYYKDHKPLFEGINAIAQDTTSGRDVVAKYLTRPAAKAPGSEPPRPDDARSNQDNGEIKPTTEDFRSDIPADLAARAYEGSSFEPEKVGEHEREAYAQNLKSAWDYFAKLANTPEKRAILEQEFPRYREGMRKRTIAYLEALSRTMSPMITGPSKFPTARNEKRLATVDRQYKELKEYHEKAKRAIKRKLTPEHAPIKSGEANTIQRLEAKLAKLEALQERMKAANRAIRMKDRAKGDAKLRELGFSDEQIEKLRMPGFGGVGFPSYEIRNNNAEIRRLKQRIEAERNRPKTSAEHEVGGVLVVEDVEANRLKIEFPGKPDPDMIAELKRRGFLWSPRNKAWQRQLTDNARHAAQDILRKVNGFEHKDARQANDTRSNQSEAKPERAAKRTAIIEDFGEKIHGARKDLWRGFRDSINGEIDFSKPLSKIWPEPDYSKLIEQGADPKAVALIRSLRDAVPNKPRKWGVETWEQTVAALRESASSVLDGKADEAIAKIGELRSHSAPADEILSRAELYQEVGHDASLKGVHISRSVYYIYGGKEYDPPKIIWEVVKDAKANMWGNMPHVLGEGDTREEAIADFKRNLTDGKLDKLLGKKTERGGGVKFDIYTVRKTGEVFIGKRIGRDVARLKKFDTVTDARAYLKEHQAELEELLARYKTVPNVRRATNEERSGKDWRNGEDVTPEKFTKTFGFRGVQFGNWVGKTRERQDLLNRTYDALMDLSEAIGVPPKALSLNGELGLAFGARGRGGKNAPLAHYEGDNVVINLTRKNGPGTLAHEWFHAFDNYMLRRAGKPSSFLTEHPHKHTSRDGKETVREALAQRFRDLMQAIKWDTAVLKRSAELDKRRTKQYWTKPREMAARVFESYVAEKLADMDIHNDFLVNLAELDAFARDMAEAMLDGRDGMDAWPYPLEDEIPALRERFDALFAELKTKETDKGIALYSKGAGGGATADAIRASIHKAFGKAVDALERKGKLEIVQDEGGLPENVRQTDGGAVHGAYDPATGKVYLVAGNMRPEEAAGVLAHEFMHDFTASEQGRKVLDELKAMEQSARGSLAKWFEDASARVPADTPEADRLHEIAAYAVQQVMSNQAKHPALVRWVKRLIAKVRAWLFRKGLTQKVDDAILAEIAVQHLRKAADNPQAQDDGGNARYSVSESKSSKNPVWNPDETWYRKLEAKLLYRFNRVRDLQEYISKGRDIEPEADAVKKEATFYGKVGEAFDRLDRDYVEPALEILKNNGLTLTQLEDYMYALHAPERNAVIRKIDPNNDAGSGITDDEARQILDSFTPEERRALDKAAGHIRRMLDDSLKKALDSGLIKQDVYDTLRAKYPHYVPLSGNPEDESVVAQMVGRRFDIRGKELERALGRHSKATNILAHAVLRAQATAIRAEKAEVGQAIARLYLKAPDPSVWVLHKIKTKPVVDEDGSIIQSLEDHVEGVPYRRKTLRNGQVVQTIDPIWMHRDNIFAFKIKGEQYYLDIRDEALARQLKGLGVEDVNLGVRALSAVNRYLAGVYTSFNPDFVLTNAARDIQTALTNLFSQTEHLEGMHLNPDRVMKGLKRDVLTGWSKAFAAIYNHEFKRGRSDFSDIYDEYRAAGGKVSFFSMQSVEKMQRELEHKAKTGKVTLRDFRRLLHAVEGVNAAVENAVRLSTYKALRDRGVPAQDAAYVVRNLTVDFNRKGEWGTTANALWLFFNASVQGGRVMFNISKNLAKTKKGRRFVATSIATGFLLAELARATMGKGDDGRDKWDFLNDYTKRRNLVIAYGPNNDDILTIPLPYGLNILPNIGYLLNDLAHHYAEGGGKGKSPLKAAVAMLTTVWTSTNPIGDVYPSILQPIVEIGITNENFAGYKINKEKSPYTPYDLPDSETYFSSYEGSIWHDIASAINRMTGGDVVKPGAIDVGPGTIRYLWNYATGGLGATVSRLIDLAKKDEIGPNDIPIVRRFQSRVDPRQIVFDYRKNIKDPLRYYDLYRHATPDQRRRIMAEHKDMIRLGMRAHATEKIMRRLYKQEKAARIRGDRAAVRRIEEAVKARAASYNRAYYEQTR